jgi:prepilin peptidase CpaA
MMLVTTSIDDAGPSVARSSRSLRERGVPRWCASLVLSGAVVASLLWTAQERPLPALGWTAAFLFLAVEHDLRRMRIPNALTLPALTVALGVAALGHGISGLGVALAGAGLAFGLLFGPFALRWLGAGDVKAMMVLGALWGPAALLAGLWWMLVVGGVLAVAWVALRGGLPDLLRRWGASAHLTLFERRPTWVRPAPGSPAAAGLPFALCMGAGAVALQLWGLPWA